MWLERENRPIITEESFYVKITKILTQKFTSATKGLFSFPHHNIQIYNEDGGGRKEGTVKTGAILMNFLKFNVFSPLTPVLLICVKQETPSLIIL
mgnify:CR=1 FL=1